MIYVSTLLFLCCLNLYHELAVSAMRKALISCFALSSTQAQILSSAKCNMSKFHAVEEYIPATELGIHGCFSTATQERSSSTYYAAPPPKQQLLASAPAPPNITRQIRGSSLSRKRPYPYPYHRISRPPGSRRASIIFPFCVLLAFAWESGQSGEALAYKRAQSKSCQSGLLNASATMPNQRRLALHFGITTAT